MKEALVFFEDSLDGYDAANDIVNQKRKVRRIILKHRKQPRRWALGHQSETGSMNVFCFFFGGSRIVALPSMPLRSSYRAWSKVSRLYSGDHGHLLRQAGLITCFFVICSTAKYTQIRGRWNKESLYEKVEKPREERQRKEMALREHNQ